MARRRIGQRSGDSLDRFWRISISTDVDPFRNGSRDDEVHSAWELSAEGADERFARLTTLLTLFDDTPFMARAFDLSITLRHGFYDCVFLAAAEALGDRLLTADAVFVGKVADHALKGSVLLLGAKP